MSKVDGKGHGDKSVTNGKGETGKDDQGKWQHSVWFRVLFFRFVLILISFELICK